MLTSRPTHGGGAPLGIDLEAGIAKITVRRPAPVVETADESAVDEVETVEARSETDDPRREDESPAS